jgi:hypothetical protein
LHVQHKFLNHFAAFVVAAAAAATATATATDLPSAVQAVVQVTKVQAMCARFKSRSGPDTARRVAGVASSMPLTEQYQTEHNGPGCMWHVTAWRCIAGDIAHIATFL